ncbi:hypothetical protein Acsp03_20670 [Actinomadura sp. NBRC 104412]|nr:hypothetical protein Acsp03_20670 [Actinomadura sp. NBRC 104412]
MAVSMDSTLVSKVWVGSHSSGRPRASGLNASRPLNKIAEELARLREVTDLSVP